MDVRGKRRDLLAEIEERIGVVEGVEGGDSLGSIAYGRRLPHEGQFPRPT